MTRPQQYPARLFMITVILILLSLNSVPSISAHFFPSNVSIPEDLLKNATSNPWSFFHQLSGCHAGEKYDGLAKLKSYFQYFGYIPDSLSNFTDDFDDALESALRTYQRNFNLNVTGQLDNQTVNHVVRPRCGNPDIVNGSTSMNSGKTHNTSSNHVHTVSHYSFFTGMPRWSKQALTYAFSPGNQLTDDVKAVFSRAFDRWSTVIPLTFTQTDSVNTADIRIGFYSGDHQDGEPFDGVLGTLAHAFSPPSGQFHLDGDENWVVTGDVTTSSLTTAVDLESVAVHEIGHLLGLGHSSVEESIMYPSISSRTKKVVLATDDIQGIQMLYGSNPNYNGSSTASVREKETGSSGAHRRHSTWDLSGFIVAVGFVLLYL
ncbi:hypothetical protein DKX38_018860 [Salix brachista]|uniref:Peptidase metallopeptidase domain-containing protein n=1 Tax=Salix brachista TaxID=2182728 RepID=A0A5N5KP95_9ROSI|nr:hypothetical protein DKX38_018860 [Salix brachista]